MSQIHGFPRLCGVARAFATLQRGQPELWEGLWRRTMLNMKLPKPPDPLPMLSALAVSGWLESAPHLLRKDIRRMLSRLRGSRLST
eukprot:scaffold122093_cov25-Prasinocladus_malaysianus.AAC.1